MSLSKSNLNKSKCWYSNNARANFKNCKQFFNKHHLLLLRDGGQSSNPYLNVVYFFNNGVN